MKTFSACIHPALATMLLLSSILTGCAPESGPPPQNDTIPTEDSQAEPDTADVPGPADGVASYIGVEHPPVPEGVEHIAGTLAQAPGEPAAEAEFAFQHVRVGSRQLLWLSELLGRDPSGEPTWRVIDAEELPTIGSDERFMIRGCSTEDRRAVAAVVEVEQQEVLTRVREAWGVDRAAGALIEMDPSGIECRNEGPTAP